MTPERHQEFKDRYFKYLTPRNGQAWFISLSVLTGTIFLGWASWKTYESSKGLWLICQLLLSFSFIQWFSLMHDYGHNNYFSWKPLNAFWGHIASFFTIIPFYPWRYIHRSHHLWTGWKDKDPTMTLIVPREIPEGKKKFINFCWRFWIPVFSLSFSFQNFWNVKKLKDMYPDKKKGRENLFSILSLPFCYGVLIFLLGVQNFFIIWGVSYLFFLIWCDPLLLSQHSGVPQKHSQGQKVKALPFHEQVDYTRSLTFPPFVTKYILLSFNNHIVHHIFPTMPGYALNHIDEQFEGSIHWLSWLKEAKTTPAVELLFSEKRNIEGASSPSQPTPA